MLKDFWCPFTKGFLKISQGNIVEQDFEQLFKDLILGILKRLELIIQQPQDNDEKSCDSSLEENTLYVHL